MQFRHIDVEPLTPTIGALIGGVDLNQVRSEDVYEEIQQALWRHGVVFFRKQPLTPDNYLRLGAKFGEMEKHEFFPHVENYPNIQLIAHKGNEAPETDRWHHDVSFRPRPNMVSILRLTDLPPSGGDTMWASCAAAYDALGTDLQQLLLGLQAEHDMPFHFRRAGLYGKLAERAAKGGSMMNSMLSADEVNAALADRECQMIKDNPTVTHPAVITHPHNGRRLLYVNSIWTKRLLGLHMDLSEALLHMLYEWLKKPEFMVRFRWEKDSIAMWDNCQTQHYAVFDYAPHYRAGQRMTCGSFEPRLEAAPAAPAAMAAPAPVPARRFALLDELDLDRVAAVARAR